MSEVRCQRHWYGKQVTKVCYGHREIRWVDHALGVHKHDSLKMVVSAAEVRPFLSPQRLKPVLTTDLQSTPEGVLHPNHLAK
jgi:hypothetical protein